MNGNISACMHVCQLQLARASSAAETQQKAHMQCAHALPSIADKHRISKLLMCWLTSLPRPKAAAGTARHGAPAHHSYPRSQHTCVARSHTIATLRTTHAHRDPANATSLLSTSLLSLPLIEPPTTWVLPPTPGQHDEMRLVLYARGSWCLENCKAPRGTQRIYRRGPRLSRRLSRRL